MDGGRCPVPPGDGSVRPVDGAVFPPGMVLKPCKSWDKLAMNQLRVVV